jgi:hypothetical protein
MTRRRIRPRQVVNLDSSFLPAADGLYRSTKNETLPYRLFLGQYSCHFANRQCYNGFDLATNIHRTRGLRSDGIWPVLHREWRLLDRCHRSLHLSVIGGADANLRIYDFNSSLSTLGSTVLGTGTFLETQLSSTPTWIRVNLSEPIRVSDSSEYAFTIIAKDPGGSATGWNNYGVNSANVYADGSRLNISSSSGAISQGTPDLAFAVITVPEPSSISLAALGVIAATHRRANRRS